MQTDFLIHYPCITTTLMQYFKLYLVQLTACNVLNTRMGFRWLMALLPCISRIIYTISVLNCLNANSLSKDWFKLHPPPPTHTHQQFTTFAKPPTDSLLLTCPCFTFFVSALSHNISHFFHIFQLSQIFSSLLMNFQLLTKAADSRCFMEGEIN